MRIFLYVLHSYAFNIAWKKHQQYLLFNVTIRDSFYKTSCIDILIKYCKVHSEKI